jgi:hypothetical protein
MSACASPPHKPSTFEGQETEAWIAFDVDPPDRYPPDSLPSFEATAQAYGCRTERLGTRTIGLAGRGFAPVSYGVAARCEGGSIALVALKDERVRIGCEKPATRESCEALLKKIESAR